MSLYLKILKSKISLLMGKPLQVKKSWVETPRQFEDMVSFLNWFDATKSIEDTLSRAKTDWVGRFKNFNYFGGLPKGSAMEIGFGGARLLTQASLDFRQVYGVDVHENFDMSRKFLKSQNVNNATLLHQEKIGEIPDSSIDFIYSFIVFQHFDSMSEVDFYLNQVNRLLSPGGAAHIYFGKNKNDGVKTTESSNFILRDCSLFINPAVMRDKLADRFEVIEYADSLPKNIDLNSGESVQAMIVFQKKRAVSA